MTFSVNALLLVQIIHFMIAYFILKHVLLKPGWIRMRREDEQDHKLERNFIVLNEEVERRTAYNEEQWAHYCQMLRHKAPQIPERAGKLPTIPCIASVAPTPADELVLVRTVKEKIVEYVRHD